MAKPPTRRKQPGRQSKVKSSPKSRKKRTSSSEVRATVSGNGSTSALKLNVQDGVSDKGKVKKIKKALVEFVKTFVTSPVPTVPFNDLQIEDSIKGILLQAIKWRFLNPRLFRGPLLWMSILLYGVPGTGKTSLITSLAHYCGIRVLEASSKTFQDSRFTKIEVLDALIEEAKVCPTILFFDEVDSLFPSRDNESTTKEEVAFISNFLLKMTELANDAERYGGLSVIAATNFPWLLDPAVIRRFSKRVEVNLPSNENKYIFIKKHLEDCSIDEDVDLMSFVSSLEFYSFSDLQNFVGRTLSVHIQQTFPFMNDEEISKLEVISYPSITVALLLEVQKLVKCSTSQRYSDNIKKWTKMFSSF